MARKKVREINVERFNLEMKKKGLFGEGVLNVIFWIVFLILALTGVWLLIQRLTA